MTSPPPSDDPLDEVLAELDHARNEPAWIPEEKPTPRRLLRSAEPVATGRWEPSRKVVLVVAGCALAALLVFGLRVLGAGDLGSAPAPRPVGVTGAASVDLSGPPAASVGTRSADGGSSPALATTASSSWSIHVVGAVRRPGVVTVRAGSRVSDAVGAAGGLAPGADASGVNMARPLVDGEQVHVPKPGEKWTPPSDSVPGGAGPAPPGSTGPGASAAGGGAVNLNTATMEQLDSLPGVGPVMAQRILDWRSEHGRFSSVDELGEVSGIGDKTLERLRPKVTV